MTLTLRSVKGSALTHVEMDGNFTHFRDRAGREYFPAIANNATDAEHDLDIGAARVWVSNGSDELLVDFEARTKRIDATWAAGTNQGGLSTGTVANNTWYYLYAVYNPTTGVADYIIDPSATSPTLPSGFTYSRRVYGATLTDGSANIRGFRHIGKREFYFTAAGGVVDINQTTSFTTDEALRTLSVPPNFLAIVQVVVVGANNNTLLQAYPTNAGLQYNVYRSTAGVGDRTIRIPVDGSSQIYTKLNLTTDVSVVYLSTHGIIDIGV